MKSVVHGLTMIVVAGVVGVAGCEQKSATPPEKQANKAVPQTAATTEPAKSAPAPPPASTEAPAANPIGQPPLPPNHPPLVPPTLGEATLEKDVMTVAGVTMKVPEGWAQEDTGTAAIRPAMKFKIPAPAGTSIEPATVGVYSGIKGTPEQNLARWLAQVNNLEGKPEKEQFQQNGLTITRLVAVGMYNPGMGMTGGQAKENWALFGLVISGGAEGDVQILAKGPKEIMLRQREKWDAFMKSAAPVKGAATTGETPAPATPEPKAAG